MKKIFFYTDTPIAGGAEKHMLLLASNLDPKKYKITLICSNYKQLDNWAKEFTQHGLDIKRLKVSHKHDPRHFFQLKKLLEREKPDILHLHLWNPGSCRYAFLAADKKYTKIISTEHDIFPLTGLKLYFKKLCLKKTTHTIAVSEYTKTEMQKLYPEIQKKISSIPNGIDLENFKSQIQSLSEPERTEIRRNLFQATKKDFIILTVAALHPRKGLQFLIEALAQISAHQKNVKLAIAGKGPQKNDLETLTKNFHLEKQIIFLGELPDIAKVLKSSDLFILPSIREMFGLAIIEAMAAKLPIIASETGGIPELIQSDRNGELAKPGDSTSLAEKMNKLLGDSTLRDKLASNAYENSKKFDISIMAQKTEQLYDKISTPHDIKSTK